MTRDKYAISFGTGWVVLWPGRRGKEAKKPLVNVRRYNGHKDGYVVLNPWHAVSIPPSSRGIVFSWCKHPRSFIITRLFMMGGTRAEMLVPNKDNEGKLSEARGVTLVLDPALPPRRSYFDGGKVEIAAELVHELDVAA